jgi:hypothetical protein
MANDIPNLTVYTPITGASTFVEDISPYAKDYQHSIRLLGGYWTANWKLYKNTDKQRNIQGLGATLYDQWRSNRYFYHFVEKWQGQPTWEGSIEGIQVDDDTGVIDCTAYGYCHTIQFRPNSSTDTGTTDADDWMETLRSVGCEFIQSGNIQTNTMQVYQGGNDFIWDEMLKVVELGNGTNGNPWQVGVYQDRRLYYAMVSATPVGFVRGGIRRRADMMNDLFNTVTVRYTDETGAPAVDYVATNEESCSLYGRRKKVLDRTFLPAASAAALANAHVYAHCWPRMNAVGCGRDVQVYDGIGCNRSISPWMVQPGVFADTTQVGSGADYLDWLTDRSHFLVDEVIANEKGVQLRTSKWTELDALEAQQDYARETGELDFDLTD